MGRQAQCILVAIGLCIFFFWVRKKFWLLPAIVMVCMLGGLLVLVEGSVIVPFIYTLF